MNTKFVNYLNEEITALEDKGLKRFLRPQQGSQGRKIIVEGKEVLNFCSNNYLGLADDKRLLQAGEDIFKNQGFGSGASRLICGNMAAHQNLEQSIARFKGRESCLVFSTGYMANLGIISSLFGREDMIFSDRFNHASIIDGIFLSQAKFKRYPHCDMQALEDMLKDSSSSGFKKRVIISDSVFSMDGDIAPLDKIVGLAQKYDCVVMIDEAHAIGVMGENGKGLAEHFDVEDEIDIQMGTLSKAVGGFGAYCCGSQSLINFLINKARSFIYTTGMPPSIAAASQKAIEIIEEDSGLRERLWENTEYLRAGLKKMGLNTMNSQTPVIPILIKDSPLALTFSQRLMERGIFASAIRPPTVPTSTARLRLTIMASHTQEDIDQLLGHCQEIGKDLCLI